MIHRRVSNVKHAQKEKLLLRKISELYHTASLDDPDLQGLSINRISLSPDKSHVIVYFYTPSGKAFFDEKFDRLKLYKPSLRAALSKEIASRYTPEIRFVFDEQFEKQQRVDEILLQISDELKQEDS